MNLLITPAFHLSEKQKEELMLEHCLFYLNNENRPMPAKGIDFKPAWIEGIVCNFFFLYNKLQQLPNLKFVQLTSAGLDRVPMEELKKKKVQIYHAKDVYAVPMAEWIIGKILSFYKHDSFFVKNQQLRKWEKDRTVRELLASVVTIVGFGNVGKNTALRLKSFGVTIRAVDILKDTSGLADEWYSMKDFERALEGADIIILTLPLTDETRHIMNAKRLSRLKKDAILINAARGALIDEEALVQHLRAGYLSGVALDVFEKEPLPKESALWKMDRVILTPHSSFIGNGNQERLFDVLKTNLQKYSGGGRNRSEKR